MAKPVSGTQRVYFYRESAGSPWRLIRFLMHEDGAFFAETADLLRPDHADDEKAIAPSATASPMAISPPSDYRFSPDREHSQWDVYDADGHCFRFVRAVDNTLVCYQPITRKIADTDISDFSKTVWRGDSEPSVSEVKREAKHDLLNSLQAFAALPRENAAAIVRQVKEQDQRAAALAEEKRKEEAKATRWAAFCRRHKAFPPEEEKDDFPSWLSDKLALDLENLLDKPGLHSTPEEAIDFLKKIADHFAFIKTLHLHSKAYHDLNNTIAQTVDNVLLDGFFKDTKIALTSDAGREHCMMLKRQHIHDLIRRRIMAIQTACMDTDYTLPRIDIDTLQKNQRHQKLFSDQIPFLKIATDQDREVLQNWIIDQALLEPQVINQSDPETGQTMLQTAVMVGDFALARLFMAFNATYSISKMTNVSPLSSALKSDQHDAAAHFIVDCLNTNDAFFHQFQKIYKALYDGQSGFFKRPFHQHPDLASVFAFTRTHPHSRTAKALELTANYFGRDKPAGAYTHPQLFKDIYEYAFSHGSWFSRSRASGSTFWNFFAAPLKTHLKDIAPPNPETLASNSNTRSVKIGRALRGE